MQPSRLVVILAPCLLQKIGIEIGNEINNWLKKKNYNRENNSKNKYINKSGPSVQRKRA
jgi:hypothetical protein